MKTRMLTATLAAAGVAVTVVATLSAAPDARAPRIVAATMQDTDRDSHADRMRLTYSERVRHAADRDGKYPFRVAGYRIQAVGKASSRTIVLALAELAAVDDTAKPTVRYARTGAGSVADLARNQAVGQLFSATAAHGNRPADTPTPIPTPTPTPTPRDSDNDGVVDVQDCGPTDPAIKPGAPDQPDLKFVDSNCDGVDGIESKAVFASPQGKDTNPGTRSAPKRTLDAAVSAAAAARKDVFAAVGTYARVEVATGVAIYGGFDARSWKRGFADDTVIEGMPEAVFADKATGVLLQLLTVNAADRGLGPGASVYGIRALNGSKLTLQNVAVRAGAAANGATGVHGAAGAPGQPGAHGAVGAKNCADGARRPGGAGGDSPVGRLGGKGGDGGKGGNGVAGRPGLFGTLGGPGGKGGEKPARGEDGAGGTRGEPGLGGDGGTNTTSLAGTSWRGSDGGFGRVGGAGNGGGGGGGGGYKKNGLFQDDWPGSGGGGGGGGGAPGRPGDGGHFGGGSFGVYLFNSALVTESSTITAGNGGRGGTGGDGGAGGKGGEGGRDVGFPCGHGGRGGSGGKGGDGGVGGAGGGGAGGPSIGVMKVGTSTAALTGTTIKVGTPGAGGSLGAGGSASSTPAQSGIARPVSP
jgi:hypothetical protein